MSPSLAMIGLCIVPPVSILAVFYGRFVRGITRQLQDSLAETSAVGIPPCHAWGHLELIDTLLGKKAYRYNNNDILY